MTANLSAPAEVRRAAPPHWLFGMAVFVAAWLVFWIQPLAVRGYLPVLGGSPAVWTTAMVFFQAALLAGYALAHFVVRRVPQSGQLAILALLWSGAVFLSPIGGVRILGDEPHDLPPAVWLLGSMAGALGIPFVAASCLAPLVQAWLARADAGAPSSDPYFLYAASNAGSVGALLAYPFILEPLLGLELQAWIWSIALIGLAPLLFVLWLSQSRSQNGAPTTPVAKAGSTAAFPAWRIIALAAVPSALLLAITQFLTTDVASVPLLWIVPLVLYLGSFIHAFARRKLVPHRVLTRLVAPALIALAAIYPFAHTIFLFGLVHLFVFAIVALYCHGTLANLRPPAIDLTRFYLFVSVGGLIGGLGVALVAPLVFSNVYEYPLALALVAVLLPAAPGSVHRGHLLASGVALIVVVAALSAIHLGAGDTEGSSSKITVGTCIALVALFAPMLLVLRSRPALLAGALLAVQLAPSELTSNSDALVVRERTFFGVYRIVETDGERSLLHGTTLHGAQWPRADGSIESRTTYYGIGTPYFDLLSGITRRPSPVAIGLAGLGTGSLACYARPEDKVRVYEIDPVVVQLARTHFAALNDCAPDAQIAVGDARLLLEHEQTSLDLLALDAFTSDAIPVHLLTVEAFQTYLQVLAPDGVLAVHISNRHLDLEPVLAALAAHTRLAARIKTYSAPPDTARPHPSTSSILVALARDEETLDALDLDADWRPLGPPDRVRVWTDDYTSVVPLFRWR